MAKRSRIAVEILISSSPSTTSLTELRQELEQTSRDAGSSAHLRTQTYDEVAGAARGAERAYDAVSSLLRASMPASFDALAHISAPHQALLASLQKYVCAYV